MVTSRKCGASTNAHVRTFPPNNRITLPDGNSTASWWGKSSMWPTQMPPIGNILVVVNGNSASPDKNVPSLRSLIVHRATSGSPNVYIGG